MQLLARPSGSRERRLTLFLKRVWSKFVHRIELCPAARLCDLILEFLYPTGYRSAARYQRQAGNLFV